MHTVYINSGATTIAASTSYSDAMALFDYLLVIVPENTELVLANEKGHVTRVERV